MNNFTVTVQNQLNFKKTLETRIAQLATTLPHPNGRGFPSQPASPVRENVKSMITRSGKTMVEPKTKLKKIGSTTPIKEEEKVEAEVAVKPRSEEEEENFGKALPKDTSDAHLLPFPRQMKKPVEDEKLDASWR
jgi:hypothetical protein